MPRFYDIEKLCHFLLTDSLEYDDKIDDENFDEWMALWDDDGVGGKNSWAAIKELLRAFPEGVYDGNIATGPFEELLVWSGHEGLESIIDVSKDHDFLARLLPLVWVGRMDEKTQTWIIDLKNSIVGNVANFRR